MKSTSIIGEAAKKVAKIIGKSEILHGGRADGMTVEDIARKHGVEVAKIKQQLAMGIKVEREHSTDKRIQREISLDHLCEIPDYYDRLLKMEKEAGIEEAKRLYGLPDPETFGQREYSVIHEACLRGCSMGEVAKWAAEIRSCVPDQRCGSGAVIGMLPESKDVGEMEYDVVAGFAIEVANENPRDAGRAVRQACTELEENARWIESKIRR